LIGESLESLIQNNVGGDQEAGTVQRQGQIKELFVGVNNHFTRAFYYFFYTF